MTRISSWLAVLTLALCVAVAASGSVAWGEEVWKEKLMDLCAKTDVAMSLSPQELKDLISGCEKLKPVIDTLDESTRKVYGKRLKMCRDLFAYVLESKTKDAK